MKSSTKAVLKSGCEMHEDDVYFGFPTAPLPVP